jgi:hypothetical protein
MPPSWPQAARSTGARHLPQRDAKRTGQGTRINPGRQAQKNRETSPPRGRRRRATRPRLTLGGDIRTQVGLGEDRRDIP